MQLSAKKWRLETEKKKLSIAQDLFRSLGNSYKQYCCPQLKGFEQEKQKSTKMRTYYFKQAPRTTKQLPAHNVIQLLQVKLQVSKQTNGSICLKPVTTSKNLHHGDLKQAYGFINEDKKVHTSIKGSFILTEV